jgi:hypothetical protein
MDYSELSWHHRLQGVLWALGTLPHKAYYTEGINFNTHPRFESFAMRVYAFGISQLRAIRTQAMKFSKT